MSLENGNEPGRSDVSRRPMNITRRNEWLFLTALCILATALCLILSKIYFNSSYFEPDGVSYLFQAKLFAQGRLYAPAPPENGFSPSPHINIDNGKWYSIYPFGHALILTPGVWLGIPLLIPSLLTG